MRPSILLHKDKEKAVRQRHPWIFSGAIARVVGDPGPGDVIDVRDAANAWLAAAEFNPASQIRARAFSWDERQPVDDTFWQKRLAASIARRRQLLPDAEAMRLVFAESDAIPGLVLDQYGSHLVLQALTAGAEARKLQTIAHLIDLLNPVSISERDDPMRRKEGLPWREGPLWGSPPAAPVIITEHGQRFYVDLQAGHKTGFYLDQAQNRVEDSVVLRRG